MVSKRDKRKKHQFPVAVRGSRNVSKVAISETTHHFQEYISDWICKNLPIEFPIDLDFLPHTICVFWSSLRLHGHSVILKYNVDLYGVWLRCEEHFSRPPPSHPRKRTRPRSKKEASIVGFSQTVPFPPQNISLSRQTIIENGAIQGKNKGINL